MDGVGRLRAVMGVEVVIAAGGAGGPAGTDGRILVAGVDSVGFTGTGPPAFGPTGEDFGGLESGLCCAVVCSSSGSGLGSTAGLLVRSSMTVPPGVASSTYGRRYASGVCGRRG